MKPFTPDRFAARLWLILSCAWAVAFAVISCRAINISPLPDRKGFTITIWQNRAACVPRAATRPTGAMSITTDWHTAHTEADKFNRIEQQ